MRAHFGPVLPVDEHHGLVGHVERSDGAAHKVVRSRAVDNVEFLVVPLHMEDRGEHRVAVFQLNGEIVAHRVFGFDGAAALDETGFKQHTFGKGRLAAARTANKRDVLNLVSLIYSHNVIDLKCE